MLTPIGSVFSPSFKYFNIPVLWYFSHDAFWHIFLEQRSFGLICGLPTEHHGHQVNQNAIGWLCYDFSNTLDHNGYHLRCVFWKIATKKEKEKKQI